MLDLVCAFDFALQDNDEREILSILREAIESSVALAKHPKSMIELFVTVLEDDGGI